MSLRKIYCLIVVLSCFTSWSLAQNEFFIPSRCPRIGGALMALDPDETKLSGCVCYSDRCEESTDKGRIELCYYSGAISINEDEQCPILKTGKLQVCSYKPMYPPPPAAAPTFGRDLNQLPDEGPAIICPEYIKQGCICYLNGTCAKSSNVNSCKNCQDDDVISVVEDGDCPAKPALNSLNNSPCKLKNHAEAYNCTEMNRHARICPLYASRPGCVCYADDTCKNTAAHKCFSCRNSNVISVLEGKACKCE